MLDHDEDLIARIARHLQQPVGFDTAVDARVMRRVAELPRHSPAGPVGRAWRWLTRSRPLQVSPLAGLALAAGIAAIAFFAAGPLRPGTLADRSAPGSPSVLASSGGVVLAHQTGRRVVQFVLFAPGASSVTLVGDFNDWDRVATPLQASHAGAMWSITVPLAPGRYRYAFVVDGTRWLADPGASSPAASDDDFGDRNSVVTVGT